MPAYDSWDALFYSLWYQPTHINLAYTLLKHIPHSDNPIMRSDECLHILDFGCGSLAMQFGIAFALADAIDAGSYPPLVVISSDDPSDDMTYFGRLLWEEFLHEINNEKRYRNLESLRHACRQLTIGDFEEANWLCQQFHQEENLSSARWLSVIHVAYEESFDSVNRSLGRITREWRPDIILVTSHESSINYAYSPSNYYYRDSSGLVNGIDLELHGEFNSVTEFRLNLYEKNVAGLLDASDERFVANYLRLYPTPWITRNLRCASSLYVSRKRHESKFGGLGNLGMGGWSGYMNEGHRDWD